MARSAGLYLDDWQDYVLQRALVEVPNGLGGSSWACRTVGLCVPRQNGKGSILEARELGGLFLLDEPLIIHSAHEFATSLEAFQRLEVLVEANPDFSRRVKRISRSHGDEGIDLHRDPRTGIAPRIRFKTRTKGGGRGFSVPLLILDEAMILPEVSMQAMRPMQMAMKNPQTWLVGSAVDRTVHEHGMVFARARKRTLTQRKPRRGWAEWSVDEQVIVDEPHRIDDHTLWAVSNPGLGTRHTVEKIEDARDDMVDAAFAAEILGVADWPDPDAKKGEAIVPAAQMTACLVEPEDPKGPLVVAFDATDDRSHGSISLCWWSGGRRHVEVAESRPNLDWIPQRLREIVRDNGTETVVLCRSASPAASKVVDIEERKDGFPALTVLVLPTPEYAKACGEFGDAFTEQSVEHTGQPEFVAGVAAADKKKAGGGFVWVQASPLGNIAPFGACTLAFWGAKAHKPAKRKPLVRAGR